jgi:hypothetical protein
MLVTILLFGVAPALRASRVDPRDALSTHRRATSGDARGAWTSGLIVAQVALSLVLIVAAGLFLSTFDHLARTSLGFESDRVLIATVSAGHVPVPPDERLALYRRAVDAVATTPGVVAAVGSFATPTVGFTGHLLATADGRSTPQRVEYNV